jgi:hypothetical protein
MLASHGGRTIMEQIYLAQGNNIGLNKLEITLCCLASGDSLLSLQLFVGVKKRIQQHG